MGAIGHVFVVARGGLGHFRIGSAACVSGVPEKSSGGGALWKRCDRGWRVLVSTLRVVVGRVICVIPNLVDATAVAVSPGAIRLRCRVRCPPVAGETDLLKRSCILVWTRPATPVLHEVFWWNSFRLEAEGCTSASQSGREQWGEGQPPGLLSPQQHISTLRRHLPRSSHSTFTTPLIVTRADWSAFCFCLQNTPIDGGVSMVRLRSTRSSLLICLHHALDPITHPPKPRAVTVTKTSFLTPLMSLLCPSFRCESRPTIGASAARG